MKLTDKKIKNAKFNGNQQKLSDGGGLFLLIIKSGKYWKYNYRFGDKQKTFSIGVYPEVSLKEARNMHRDARKLVANGIDPTQVKQDAKRAAESEVFLFKDLAMEWFENKSSVWAESHSAKTMSRLRVHIIPHLGGRKINDIDARELLRVIRRIESAGTIETAHRVKQICGQIFRYGVSTGRADRDPSGDLKDALKPYRSKNMATILDPQEIGALLRAIDGYTGFHSTRCAFKLAPLTFVRPGELRKAEWSEIDFDNAVWKISAGKMKLRRVHWVPLSKQALEILQELHPLTGKGKYLFPNMRSAERPMSENTINAALRRMGYSSDEMCGHGFRSMASTLLHEMGFEPHVIERQLAHAQESKVAAAYNHAEYIDQRRLMMQAWADYLDSLKSGENKVVPLFKAAGGEAF